MLHSNVRVSVVLTGLPPACCDLTSPVGCRSYPDVWRRLHPGETGVYTVWDEKTSARIFNEVGDLTKRQRRRPPATAETTSRVADNLMCAVSQGVRIDYVLASQGLLDKIVSCEVILDLPPKWYVIAMHIPCVLPRSSVPVRWSTRRSSLKPDADCAGAIMRPSSSVSDATAPLPRTSQPLLRASSAHAPALLSLPHLCDA